MELRDQMQRVALESPAYGYRRITAELQQRGFAVNHKRVLGMMREDNLLCVRGRAFVVTTDSRHHLPVYPNLARDITPTAINQPWIADITYIRLRAEFVYLAVVLDAFSRRVIGWALGRTLEASLAVSALRMALIERQPAAGLVHHSDRGVQYASLDYTEMLKQHKAAISMTSTYLSYVLPEPDVNHQVSLLSDDDGDHYEDTVTPAYDFGSIYQRTWRRLQERW
jgi:transposase InsO family protein